MYTLILYIVISGHMSVVRIPQTTLEACDQARVVFAAKLKAVHAECKVKRAAK